MPGAVPYWESPQSQENWGGWLPYLNSRVKVPGDPFPHSSPSLGPHIAGVAALTLSQTAMKADVKFKFADCRGRQNSGTCLLNVMVPYGSSVPSITFPERPCTLSTSFSGQERPLLESLKLSMGTFNSLPPLLTPTLRTLYYLAHFTDMTTVAQKGLSDLSNSPSQ